MKLEQMISSVAKWAESEPLVRKAYLFGSRVKGSETEESDLDVAIEVNKLGCDSNEFTTYAHESAHLRSRLAALIPFKLDLQWYGGKDETPKIHAALSEASILVFDREAQPIRPDDA